MAYSESNVFLIFCHVFTLFNFKFLFERFFTSMAKTRLTFCSQTSCDWAVYMLSAYRQFAGTIFVSPERHRKSLWASLRAADTDLAASGLYTQPVLPPIGQPYVLTAYSVYYVHKLDVQGGTWHLPPPRRRTWQLLPGRGGCTRGQIGICQSAAAAVMVGGVFVCSGAFLQLGPFCRLPAASPRWWIGERPPDMAASCDIYK